MGCPPLTEWPHAGRERSPRDHAIPERYFSTERPERSLEQIARRKVVALPPENFLKRILKPAAIRAKIALGKNAEGREVTGCTFQSLRRTAATLFGARAKDPRLKQAHLRHADPRVTLKHYQKAIPAEVRAAALALETDSLAVKERRESEREPQPM